MGFFIMSDISTTELLNSSNESLQKKMHVALPAKVVSFNASEQTVTIELMITQMAHDDSMLDLPPLVDCPVAMLSYGSFSITAAPQKGDEGLAHFAERCIDGWWLSGKKSVPLDVRFNDLSDAFFAPFYKSKPNALTIYAGAMNIGSTNSYIRLFDNGTIEVKGATKFLDPVTAPDFTTDEGISLNEHLTSGVQTGSGTSGKPIP